MILAGLSALLVFGAMIAEATVAARNDRHLRTAGAAEPRGDVYRIMQVAYPACFVAILAEGAWHRVRPDAWFAAGAAVFIIAKALKYWAIASLGSRWTFRVLVPPGSERIDRGPYRWIAHPNYVGVAGELIGAAVAMQAVLTGPIAVAVFCILMIRRVVVEEKALAGVSSPPDSQRSGLRPPE
jgi:methyltransferase